MRPSLWRRSLSSLAPAAVVLTLTGAEARACSGPGAWRAIMISELVGTFLAGLSIAVVVIGRRLVRRRVPGRRIRWIMALLALHPRLWMDAGSGDCGAGLVLGSIVATIGIAFLVGLAICWPSSADARTNKQSWTLSGALLGSLFGLLIVAAMLVSRLGPSLGEFAVLAVSVLLGAVLSGAFLGDRLFHIRARDGRWRRISLTTLLLAPVALGPLIVVLLPVLPYEASVSTTGSFDFVVLDERTGRPVPNASLRLLDPRFAPNDSENQGEEVVTGADGRAPYYLFAHVHGREGLLGKTEAITYAPWLIQVEAQGYRRFLTSLAEPSPLPADRLTAAPLGLTFPPPASAIIRLSPDVPNEAPGAP